jgi:hypothetical protein
MALRCIRARGGETFAVQLFKEMKKILILTLTCYFARLIMTYAQIKSDNGSTLSYCQIINPKIESLIGQYLIRNRPYERKRNGIVLIKFYSGQNDTAASKLIITQMLFDTNIRQNKPKAFILFKGAPILIYGSPQVFNCKKKNYEKFYAWISKQFLISDPNRDSKIKHKKGLILKKDINFDPEILEITLKRDSVISQKELSVQPNLGNSE